MLRSLATVCCYRPIVFTREWRATTHGFWAIFDTAILLDMFSNMVCLLLHTPEFSMLAGLNASIKTSLPEDTSVQYT
jgi:hypothetical protein